MYKPRYLGTIGPEHRHKVWAKFGSTLIWWPDVIGYVQELDYGKRVYAIRDNANVRDVIQVESTEQRDRRISSHG